MSVNAYYICFSYQKLVQYYTLLRLMTKKPTLNLSHMVGYGGVKTIAEKLGLSQGAASAALRRGSPGHPVVREALRMAEESGALSAAQTLATLKAA